MFPSPTSHGQRPWRLAVAASALLAGAAGSGLAATATHNVSQLVLGVHEALPQGTARTFECGSACRFAGASGVQMSNGDAVFPGPYETAAWPVFFSSAAPNHATTEKSLGISDAPNGTQYVTLAPGLLQRARVGFPYLYSAPAAERRLDVQTFRSGSGASAVSYAVRIEAPPGSARPTYLRFAVPTQVRAQQLASDNGGAGQPVVTYPKHLQARSIVDVYVDGLPVWSAQSMLLRPRRFPSSLGTTLALEWDQPLDGGTATLFLGSLPPGSVRTAVIVLRSDLRVENPTCYTVSNVLGDDWRRCDARQEGLTLPSRAEAPFYIHTPDIAVYSR